MTNNQKMIIPIKGMHCKSCELLIEDELHAVPGVKKIRADWRRSEAEIRYAGQQPDQEQITQAIRKAGYEVGQPDEVAGGFFSSNKEDYRDLGIAVLFLLGLYLILKGLGWNNLNLNTSSGLTLPIILLIGLTAGFSTCMAMVGGLVLGISAKYSEHHPEATPSEKFFPHILFNSGRVLSYTVLGGVLGLLGSAFQLSGTVLGLITIAVGLIMLIMGLQLISIFPWMEKIKFTLPKGLARAFGLKARQHHYSDNNAFMLGALTFFLPCGFTQAMQVYAVSTGNFFSGAMVMGAFALGTLPGLLSIGGITSAVKGLFAKRFFKFAGLAVLLFAFFNITNGLGLAGLDWPSAPSRAVAAQTDPNVTIENGVQVVRMKETNNGYEPNNFTIRKGLPVKWIVDAQAPYSCAATILMSKFNIRKNLVAGENVIEFTPTEVGRLKFSCSMGMYTGSFEVVDSKDQSSAGAAIPVALASAPGSGTCGVSGSGGGGGGCGCGGGGKKFTPTTGDVSVTSAQTGGSSGSTGAAGSQATQNISSTYTYAADIVPNTFTVKAGVPVHYVVDVKEDGVGCMSSFTIPGLSENIFRLTAGQPLVMDFTPSTPGTYLITCAMGVPRGKIIVE